MQFEEPSLEVRDGLRRVILSARTNRIRAAIGGGRTVGGGVIIGGGRAIAPVVAPGT